jgi:PilZ domain-containing protein
MSPAPNPRFVPYERRQTQRYPITAQTQFILTGIRGQAITSDISSGGVFLKTDRVLPVGKQIQLFIDWPALLDQRCPLRLVVTGKTLRSDEKGTAVGIIRYDFRIRPRRATPFAA